MVVLGSSIYNGVSKYYLDHKSCCFSFVRIGQHRALRIHIPGAVDQIVERVARASGATQEIGIIQRINDAEHGTTVFICAGTGSSATYATVRYLARKWPQLLEKYGVREFAIYMTFPDQPPDSETVSAPGNVTEVKLSIQ